MLLKGLHPHIACLVWEATEELLLYRMQLRRPQACCRHAQQRQLAAFECQCWAHAALCCQVSEHGLSGEEAKARLAHYGPNKLPESRQSPILKFLGYMWNPLSWYSGPFVPFATP
jgi:hypothetical protein